MKVMITGATGFIGGHLVRRLIADGHELRCLVRRTSRLEALKDPRITLVYGDVTDRESLRAAAEGCDWLFHLANLYSMWEPDRRRFSQVNIEGTRCVLETALEAGVRKVVYVSTVAIYGKPEALFFTEDCAPGPVLFSEYARTKAAADRLAWSFYEQRALPLVVLYPGIVLGAGDHKASGQYIQDIIRRRVPSTIFHDSKATYVHVADVVDALVNAAQRPETVGQKYLVGQETLDGGAFVRLISQISGVPLPLFHFPDWMVLAAAYLLTGLAAVTRRPPLWGLSVDAAWTLKHGFHFDGSKAARELDLSYRPVRCALEEAIASYRGRRASLEERCYSKGF